MEGKKRWCGACGKAKGAISLTAQSYTMCESCGNKHAHFGTPEEGKKRWCGACGKAKSAISLAAQFLHLWPLSRPEPTNLRARH